MARKVIISADGTCDLGSELPKRYDISIINLYVNMDGKSYRDNAEITPEDIYEYYNKKRKLPTTSACSIADYMDYFKEIAVPGGEIVHLNIGNGFSVSHQNAKIAAAEIGGVHVINTKQLSSGTGILAIEAALMADNGAQAHEIVEKINALREKVSTSFLIETLEFLYKGGRCSGVAALGANILRLRPCIEVEDGAMHVGKKYRGQYKNVIGEYAVDKLANRKDLNTDRILVTHSGTSDENIKIITDKIKSLNSFKEILVTRAGCVISTHCGANTIGIIFMTK